MFAWDRIVNLHVRICKNKICIWSDPGVNLPICKYTLVCICVRMRHLLTPCKICTPEHIYTRVFLAHANWTKHWEIRVCITFLTTHVYHYLIFLFGSIESKLNDLWIFIINLRYGFDTSTPVHFCFIFSLNLICKIPEVVEFLLF